MVLGIGCIVEIDIKITLEEGKITTTEVVTEIIDPTIGIAVGLEIETATDRYNSRSSYRREDSSHRYGNRNQD